MNYRPLRAYGGDEAFKALVIQRLQHHFDAGHQAVDLTQRWSGEPPEGTLMGLTAHAETAEAYELALGWPAALGRTHEDLFVACQVIRSVDEGPSLIQTAAFARPQLTAWLQAITPGRDLHGALLRFQTWFLDDLLAPDHPLAPLPSSVADAVRALHELLERSRAGERVDDSAFAEIRQRGASLTPEAHPTLAPVLDLVEAMAWPQYAPYTEWTSAFGSFLDNMADVGKADHLSAEIKVLKAAEADLFIDMEAKEAADPAFDAPQWYADAAVVKALADPAIMEQIEQAALLHAQRCLPRLFGGFVASLAVATDDAVMEPSSASGATEPVPVPPASVLHEATLSSYQAEVLESPLPVLLDFWAPWCGPCMQLMPTLQSIAHLYAGRVKVVKLNADDNVELMKQFGVRGIPSLFLLKGGHVVAPVQERSKSRIAAVLDRHLGT